MRHEWRKESGVISFDLVADGTTGEQWIARTQKHGNRMADWDVPLLKSEGFVSSRPGVYQVVVLTGEIFRDRSILGAGIVVQECIVRRDGLRRGLIEPNPDIAFLTREAFSDEIIAEMGLSHIVVFSRPIELPGMGPAMFSTFPFDGGRLVTSVVAYPDSPFDLDVGFAFLVPPTV